MRWHDIIPENKNKQVFIIFAFALVVVSGIFINATNNLGSIEKNQEIITKCNKYIDEVYNQLIQCVNPRYAKPVNMTISNTSGFIFVETMLNGTKTPNSNGGD